MKWTVALIPSAFSAEEDPPDTAWRALTEDSRPIECIVWGKGTEADPMRLFVRVGRPDAGPGSEWKTNAQPPPRMPFFEEVLDAADHVPPVGAIFHLGAYTSGSRGRGAELKGPFPPEVDWVGMFVQQIGTVPGSPAARSSLILSHGGGNAN